MCVVSMVMDHYDETWRRRINRTLPWRDQTNPITVIYPQPPLVSQEEVDEFRRLLERAREYDRRHAEPDCELDEKRRALKTLAREVGVEIDFLDSPGATSAPVSPDPALPATQVAPER